MVNPEKVPDVDEGTGSDLMEGGLTAEEQAAFDSMQKNAPEPAVDQGEAEPVVEGGGDRETHADADEDDDVPAAEGAERVKPKTIAYGKHQRLLKKNEDARTTLAAELAQEREKRARLDERTKLLLEAINAKPQKAEPEAVKEPEDVEPNIEDDPLGHAAWTRRELGRTQAKFAEFEKGYNDRQTQATEQGKTQSVMNAYTADLESAARAAPEFGEAFVHLRDTRYRELGFIYAGIDINDKDQCKTLPTDQQAQLSTAIQRAFENEQLMVANESARLGKRPSEVVLNLARARGFVPKPAEIQANQGGVQPAPRKAPSVADEVRAIKDGQAASRSLSDAGGAPGGDLDANRLANMTDDEFMEFYDSTAKGKLDKLMGKIIQ